MGAQGRLFTEVRINGRARRIAGGVATSDVTMSAHVAGNADVFPQILALHVPPGSVVADVTWGKGYFGKRCRVSDMS